MARKVPASPARADAELDRLLDRAPPPAMPPGLAARIVAQATALPQIAAEPVAEVAPVAPRETAQVIPFAAPEPSAPVPSRKRFAVGGLAAIAATFAAVVLMGQPGRGPAPQDAAAVMAQQQPAAAPLSASADTTEPVAVTEPAAQLAQRLAAHPDPAGTGFAAKVAEAPASPSMMAQAVAPEAKLAATPAPAPRESAGPTSDPSPRPAPPRGLMGPPAPQQGWAFSGGSPGGSLPGGQSLPSQTTGSAPPPPPPSGN